MKINGWLFFLLMLSAGVLFTGCDDDDDNDVANANVNLQFLATFDGEPLVMYDREYDYLEGMRVRFQLFQYYISDVQLVRQDGQGNTELVDIDLVAYGEVTTDAQAQEGIQISLTEVPPGEYSGIRMGLGVSQDLNATQPGDYAPGHPLSGHYWSASTGYVFTKIEGNADLDGDGNFSEKLTFHIGTNPAYREVSFNAPIAIGSGETVGMQFTVDVMDVLSDGQGQFVDFRQVATDHTNDMELVNFLSDNLVNALQMQQQ